MAMLRARLVREQNDFFRAEALGVDVDDDLCADILQDVAGEVDDFDAFPFLWRQLQSRGFECRRSALTRLLDLHPGQHVSHRACPLVRGR